MDKLAIDKLHLTPRSTEELHTVLSNFEMKWQNKASRQGRTDRISRY